MHFPKLSGRSTQKYFVAIVKLQFGAQDSAHLNHFIYFRVEHLVKYTSKIIPGSNCTLGTPLIKQRFVNLLCSHYDQSTPYQK